MKGSKMKDSSMKEFFAQHKQNIEDEGFSERLFATLECMPNPIPIPIAKVEKFRGRYLSINNIVMLLFTLVGFALFFIFGGYSVVIESLVLLSSAVTNIALFTPQIIISILFLIGSLFAVGKLAIDAE